MPPVDIIVVQTALALPDRCVLIDTFSPENDEFDTLLNRIELLRDSSYVRQYRVSEWRDMFEGVGFDLEDLAFWVFPLELEDWVTRSRTLDDEVAGLGSCLASVSARTRKRFGIDDRRD